MALPQNISPMQAAVARAAKALGQDTPFGMAHIAEDLGFDTHPANLPGIAFFSLGRACFQALENGDPQAYADIRIGMDAMAQACREQSALHAETLAMTSFGGGPASGLDLLLEASGAHFSHGFFSRFFHAPHRREIVHLAGEPVRRSVAWGEVPSQIFNNIENCASFLEAEKLAAPRYASFLNAIAPTDASFRSGILVGCFLGHSSELVRRYPAGLSPKPGFSHSRIADMFFSMDLASALAGNFGFPIGPLASTGMLGRDRIASVVGCGSFGLREFILSAANSKADGLAALAEAHELAESAARPGILGARKPTASL